MSISKGWAERKELGGRLRGTQGEKWGKTQKKKKG